MLYLLYIYSYIYLNCTINILQLQNKGTQRNSKLIKVFSEPTFGSLRCWLLNRRSREKHEYINKPQGIGAW